MLYYSFTPFMVGSISLIAFLSIRNTYLAGKARDLCDKLRKEEDAFWQTSMSIQLLYFVHRYKISNLALILSILAVFFFGGMTGTANLLEADWKTSFSKSLPYILLVLGGTMATLATIISVYETYIARRSLFNNVASTYIAMNCSSPDASLLATLDRIKLLIRDALDRDIYGKYIEKLETITHLSRNRQN